MLWAGAEAQHGVHLADAMVLDEGQATRFGNAGCFLRRDPKLEPENLGADLYGLVGDIGAILGWPEHIDDVHRLGDFQQRGVALFAEDRIVVGIDGDDSIAMLV